MTSHLAGQQSSNMHPNTPHKHALLKRGTDWPHKNAGVMVVFCIVFLVAVTLVTLFVRKRLIARRVRKEEALHLQMQMGA